MVAWLPLLPPDPGDSSRYLPTLSPKPRPLLGRLRGRLNNLLAPGLQIQWPEHWPGRIRKVISRSGTRRRYIVPCYRYGELEAHGEAKEEELAFILLDACDGVEFQEQPCRLSFRFCGEVHEHVPDLLVAREGQCEFWECKRKHEATQFWIRKRAECLRALLATYQIGYRVVSTTDLLTDGYIDNAKLLRRFAKYPVSEKTELEAMLEVREAGQLAIGQLAEKITTAEPLSAIYALLYSGKLRIDLSAKISKESLLHILDDGNIPWVWQLFARAKE